MEIEKIVTESNRLYRIKRRIVVNRITSSVVNSQVVNRNNNNWKKYKHYTEKLICWVMDNTSMLLSQKLYKDWQNFN